MPDDTARIQLEAILKGFQEASQAFDNLKQKVAGLGPEFKNVAGTAGAAATGIDKIGESSRRSVSDLLHLHGGIAGFIKDMETMITIQLRWYAARALIFGALSIPVDVIKAAVAYSAELDEWNSKMLRWSATSGQVTNAVRVQTTAMINDMRQQLTQMPLTLKELGPAVESFLGAGLPTNTVREMLPDIAKFKTAFKEVNFEEFAVAAVGAFNVFKNQIKGAGSDADKFRVIFEQLLRAQAVGIIRPEQFTKVLQYLGEISHIAGLTTEQMFSMAVAVSDTGIRAASAARYISGFMDQLAKPAVQQKLAQIGIQLDKQKDLGSQLDKIFTTLNEKIGTAGGTSVEALGFLTTIMPAERMRGFLALLQNYDKYKALVKEVAGAEGGLAASSAVMTKNMKAQWQILVNLVTELSVALTGLQGTSLNVIVAGLVDMARGALVALDTSGRFSEQLKQLGTAGQTTYGFITSLSQVFSVLVGSLQAAYAVLGPVIGLFLQLIQYLIETRVVIELLANIIMVRLVTSLLMKIGLITQVIALLVNFGYWIKNIGFLIQWVAQVSIPGFITGLTGMTGGAGLVVIAIGAIITALILLSQWLNKGEKALEDFNNRAKMMTPVQRQKEMWAQSEWGADLENRIKEMEAAGIEKERPIMGMAGGGMYISKKWKEYEDLLEQRKQTQAKIASLQKAQAAEEENMPKPPAAPETKGTGGFPPTEQIKTYALQRLQAVKEYWNAVLQMDKVNLGNQMAQLTNSYKKYLITEEEWYAQREALEEAFAAKEIENIDKYEKPAIEAEIALKRKEINASLKSGEDKKNQLAALQFREDAELQKLETKKAEIHARVNNQILADDIEMYDKRRQRAIDSLNFLAELENLRTKSSFSTKQWANSQEQAMAGWVYDRQWISANEYYNKLNALTNQEVNLKKATAQKEFDDWKNVQELKMSHYTKLDPEYQKLDREMVLREQQLQNDLAAVDQEGVGKRLEIQRKASDDIRAVWESGAGANWRAVVKTTLNKQLGDWYNWGQQVQDLTRGIAEGAQQTLSSVLFDAMQGKLKTAKDYWNAFAGGVEKILSDITTKFFVGKLVEGAMGQMGMQVDSAATGMNTMTASMTGQIPIVMSLSAAYMELTASLEAMNAAQSAGGGGGMGGGGGGGIGGLFSMFGGGGNTLQGWAAGDLAMTAFHSGGVIKGGTMRKFHGGGGLNPDEKIIIGKAGERVFSQEQSQMVQEMYDSIKNGPAAGGDTHIHNYHINTIDGPSTASFFRNNRRIVADTIQMAKASNHPVRRK